MTESKIARKQADKVKAFKRVFDSEDGQYVLYQLMVHTKMFSPLWDGNRDNLLFNEGQRNVLLSILSQLEIDPMEIIQKYKRQREKERAYEI